MTRKTSYLNLVSNQPPHDHKASFLKLVVSNSATYSSWKQSKIKDSNVAPSFTTKITSKMPSLYEMSIQDSDHFLSCDLVLEVEKHEKKTIICHLSSIIAGQADEFMEEDEALSHVILTQFQMKIFEQLLLFSYSHQAPKLLIFIDDIHSDIFKIYKRFLVDEISVASSREETEAIAIPIDAIIFDHLKKFMKKIMSESHQVLWRKQSQNPMIRKYLKSQILSTMTKSY